MKKNSILVFFVLILTHCNIIFAKDTTPAQRNFQNSLMTFLREEGFSPSIDDENSLLFKKEGILYWINIAEDSPFYIEFHRNGFKCTDANMAAVYLACNESNKKTKCAKSRFITKLLRCS